MPVKSSKQLAFMLAARAGQVPSVAPEVGREFLDAPKKKTKLARGLAMKKGAKSVGAL